MPGSVAEPRVAGARDSLHVITGEEVDLSQSLRKRCFSASAASSFCEGRRLRKCREDLRGVADVFRGFLSGFSGAATGSAEESLDDDARCEPLQAPFMSSHRSSAASACPGTVSAASPFGSGTPMASTRQVMTSSTSDAEEARKRPMSPARME
eukprot:4475198-Prymnesium_polylepis.1